MKLIINDFKVQDLCLQIRTTIADIAIATVAGALWTIAFEYPGINLEQAIFGSASSSRQNNYSKKVSEHESSQQHTT